MRRYLIIDDSLTARTKLAQVLQAKDVEIVTSDNGAHGTSLAAEQQPDVAIVDVVLPDTDGMQLCHEWQGHPLLRAVPVLLVSAQRADQDARVAGLRAGAMGYLVKPFDDRELLAQVELLYRLGSAQRELRQRFLHALESAPSPMLLLDRSGLISLVNQRTERLFGYAHRQLEGRSLCDLLPDLTSAAGANERFDFSELCVRPFDPDREFCGRRADGSLFPLSAAFNPTQTDEGPAALAAIVDLSAHKRAEAELRHAADQQRTLNGELLRKNRELADFAHLVSHDLKAPLRAIGSLTDCIVEDCGDRLDGESLKHLALLKSRTQRMHALIGAALSYSALGHGEQYAELLDSAQAARAAIDSLGSHAHVDIQIECPLPAVYYDRSQLVQIFSQLIGNAIRYMDKEHGQICVSGIETTEGAQFCVEDDGPGIPARQRERIFGFFQTLAPRDRSEASGAGLAIVRKIVEENGGSVWVEPAVKGGSRFLFTVPGEVHRPPSPERGQRP